MEVKDFLKLPIIVKKDDNDTLYAYCPIFKGCHTFGENKIELKGNLEDVIGMYFDIYKDGDTSIIEGDKTLFLNFDNNGKITSDFSKEFNKNTGKVLMKKN